MTRTCGHRRAHAPAHVPEPQGSRACRPRVAGPAARGCENTRLRPLVAGVARVRGGRGMWSEGSVGQEGDACPGQRGLSHLLVLVRGVGVAGGGAWPGGACPPTQWLLAGRGPASAPGPGCSAPLLTLPVSPRQAEYADLVETLLSSQQDPVIYQRLADAFSTLTASSTPPTLDRKQKVAFLKSLEELMANVGGLLCVK